MPEIIGAQDKLKQLNSSRTKKTQEKYKKQREELSPAALIGVLYLSIGIIGALGALVHAWGEDYRETNFHHTLETKFGKICL